MSLAEKCRQASLRGRTVTVDIVPGVVPNYKLKQRWPDCQEDAVVDKAAATLTRTMDQRLSSSSGLAGAMEHSP